MAPHLRSIIRVTLFSVLLYFLAFLPATRAQQPPADAAELSRDLLFLAPNQIDAKTAGGAVEVRFSATRFTYVYSVMAAPEESPWKIEPSENAPSGSEALAGASAKKLTFSLGSDDYTVSGMSDDDRATVVLHRAGSEEPVATAVVWTRDQLSAAWLPFLQRQRKSLTAASLQQDLEVGDPLFYDLDHSGDSVWVAVGHSTGELELGLGTFVRFDVKTGQAAVFHPAELSTCAVTQLAVGAPDELLLGTRHQFEGTILPCAGLVRFHASNGQMEKIAAEGTPLANAVVTALRSGASGGWVATGKGICSLSTTGPEKCWCIVPTVTLKEKTPVSNRPGDKPSGDLKPGDYEVLWANQNFLELATKDSFDAWLAADDFAEAAARNFDVEPYKLLNTAAGPAPIRPLTKPNGAPLEGALVYRAPLEKQPTPSGTPAGWVKVRARIGWIPSGDRAVTPKLVRVETKP